MAKGNPGSASGSHLCENALYRRCTRPSNWKRFRCGTFISNFLSLQTIRVFSPPDQGQMGAILGRPAPQDSWTESWVDRIDRELIWGDKPRGKTVGAQKPAAEHDASRALTYSLTRQDSFLLGTPKVWDECTSSFQLVRRGRSESPLAAANLGIRPAPAARNKMSKTSDLVLEDAS